MDNSRDILQDKSFSMTCSNDILNMPLRKRIKKQCQQMLKAVFSENKVKTTGSSHQLLALS